MNSPLRFSKSLFADPDHKRARVLRVVVPNAAGTCTAINMLQRARCVFRFRNVLLLCASHSLRNQRVAYGSNRRVAQYRSAIQWCVNRLFSYTYLSINQSIFCCLKLLIYAFVGLEELHLTVTSAMNEPTLYSMLAHVLSQSQLTRLCVYTPTIPNQHDITVDKVRLRVLDGLSIMLSGRI